MNRWRALNPSLRGALVMVMVGMLVVAGGWWFDSRNRAEAGPIDVAAELHGDQRAHVNFELPNGSVQVSIDAGETTADDEVRAPRGGRLVHASWKGQRPIPNATATAPAANSDSSIKLRLRVGGDKFTLDDNLDLQREEPNAATDQSALFAVSTPNRHLVVEVEFAGESQSVDVATGERTLGAFAPYYRQDLGARIGLHMGSAPIRQRSHDLLWTSTWKVGLYRVPYLEGHGWAKPGREWVTLTDSTLSVGRVYSDNKNQLRYQAKFIEPARVSVAVDGGREVRTPKAVAEPVAFSDAGLSITSGAYDVARGRALVFRLAAPARIQAESYGSGAEEDRGEFRPGTVTVAATAHAPAVLEPGADR
ncbi:hypothetical protein [Demetria terragena]|uniref:hypothetical protein n=1 Tax=Demetria terragena TaxID=63959 RepID=UPI00036E884D|nr:hypothetical protein [Demetria terragena]